MMKWEKVRAPAAKRAPAPAGGEDAPRRYLSPRTAAGAAAGLLLLIVLLVWINRKPAAPELLRPAGAAATAPPSPAAKEYKSENVILRFPEPGETSAGSRR